MTHIRLILQRSSEQEDALGQYLAELQQKSSANYHKWLTPTQFGTLYGPADSDIAVVTAWLEAKGLTITSLSKGRTNIEVAGTAAQVEQAFQTPIHSFQRGKETFYANTMNPTIPSALSSVVSGVVHLNSYKAKTLNLPGKVGTYDAEAKRLKAVDSLSSNSSSRPQLSISSSGSYYLYLVPGDAATIYNTPNSTLNANFSSSTSYTGSGVVIGIGGDARISDTTPVTNYRSLFVGDSTTPTLVNVDSNTSTDDADEAYLDMEIAGGLAPGASIRYYQSSDLYSAIEQALSDNVVDIFSLSFGLCELGYTTSDNQTIKGWWQQAATQGIAVTVSSGDSGSAGCEDPSSDTQASYGLQVNGLASTAYNIAVGGTDFSLSQSNFSTYANTSNSSSTYYRTAKSHIPETTWNDSTSINTTLSSNVAYSGSSANIVAGGGGKSNCASNTNTSSTTGTCTAGWSKPSWQRGTGVPSDSVRDLPDISLMSGAGGNYSAWLVCTNDTVSSYTTNCSSSNGSYYFYGFGGTSAAAPAFAGILALVQQSQGGGRLGQTAANLYNIYNNSSNASSVFHDITTGNISVPCKSSSSYGNCSKNSAGYYFLTGYDTTTGYDLATGLGSVDVTSLISNWSSGTGSSTASVSVTPSTSSITTVQTLTLTINVSGSSETPSGSVVVSGGGYTSSSLSLDSGSVRLTIPAGSFSAGTYTLTATYSGDGIYSSAAGTASVTVTTSTSTSTTTTLSASSTSVTYGTSVTLTAIVSPSAATGSVTFYNGSTTLGSSTLSSGTATYTTTALPVGTDTITATYAGDSSYASSTSSSITVTVSSSSSSSGSFSLAATNVTVQQGSSGTSTVTITPANSYTGTVSFTLTTTSSSLASYGCYKASNAKVTGTSSVTTTLTIYTSSSACTSTNSQHPDEAVHTFSQPVSQAISSVRIQSHPQLRFSWAFPLLVCLPFLSRRRRRQLPLLIACVVLAISELTGCGNSSSSTSHSDSASSSGTVATGSYSLTLTGTDTSDSSLSATTTLTLTVN